MSGMARRSFLLAAGCALLAAPGATAQRNRATEPPAPETDLSTPEGWLEWIRHHPDDFGLVLDNGYGDQLLHQPRTPRPLASAVKVVHLAAYAEAVATGRLHPDEQIRVGDWERYYVPTDGWAHKNALTHLGIPLDPSGLHAADPEHVVRLDDVVSAMIMFSDSAAPDYLRNRLGPAALHQAAEAAGWHQPDIRSMCAEYLYLVLPETAPPAHLPVAARRRHGFALERRFAIDEQLRQRMLQRLGDGLPPYPVQQAWAAKTMAATPTQLARLHTAIATGRTTGAELARTHLERPLSGSLPPGVIGIGHKGGSLPGVLTTGMAVRRENGSTATGVLLVHGGISAEEMLNDPNPAQLVLLAVEQPAWWDRLATALHR
ncbi:MAG: serine hydrolase [Saccharopolyspora rectivirgula]